MIKSCTILLAACALLCGCDPDNNNNPGPAPQPAYPAAPIVLFHGTDTVAFATAFIPNGDGRNDYFRPIASSSSVQCGMSIHPAGSLVSAINVQNSWDGTNADGTPADTGVYQAALHITFSDGTTTDANQYLLMRRVCPDTAGWKYEDQFDPGNLGAGVAYPTGETPCP